ncbi:uncharacterized protein B0I36DRAFT_143857 [Microdochium trichocladiopsis]|uniref:Uncharacterized protein n=1 Tax=Microdochium trichocladiopsis TaxID=1682393 RepID=A0A9P9BS04_9PEZI|nr:uncharacterized protein B0I36DRAFT_143857 [Microdochium trichocladiopsis]KAH7027820.1 hypothetical protein B0I36DRAFT_143857 [Microdochium trichocladiopsis]
MSSTCSDECCWFPWKCVALGDDGRAGSGCANRICVMSNVAHDAMPGQQFLWRGWFGKAVVGAKRCDESIVTAGDVEGLEEDEEGSAQVEGIRDSTGRPTGFGMCCAAIVMWTIKARGQWADLRSGGQTGDGGAQAASTQASMSSVPEGCALPRICPQGWAPVCACLPPPGYCDFDYSGALANP